MAKKERKEKEKLTISSEEQRKMERAARRKVDLEKGTFIRGGAHKTAKKDVVERTSTKISTQELEELIEEEDIYDEYSTDFDEYDEEV